MANVLLPNNSLRLHQTPEDMANANAISRMYGGYNVRPGWMYPQGPYGSGLRGLGFDYYDLLDQSGREDCDPRDSNCVARNQERVTAVQDLWMTQYMTHPETAGQPAPRINITLDTSQRAYDAFENNTPLTTERIGVNGGTPFTVSQLEQRTAVGSDPVPSAYHGKVTFATSTGDTGQLKPGDTWRITITGAQPGAPVVVTGGQNGRHDVTPMGNTDGNGSWTASGAIDTSMIGTWAESWTVGGASVGSIGFTVVAATQQQQSGATGKPNAGVPPSNPLVPGDPGFGKTADKLGGGGGGTTDHAAPEDNSTLLLIAAGLAAVMFMTRSGR